MEKSGLFLVKSSALSLKRSPFPLTRRVVFSHPPRRFFSPAVSFALARRAVVSAIVHAATTARSSPRARVTRDQRVFAFLPSPRGFSLAIS